MTNHILLLGAGFSRNWGGWLVDEAFEHILGSLTNQRVIDRMWEARENDRGFEDVLGSLQEEYQARRNDSVRNDLHDLESAIRSMFNQMDTAFQQADWYGEINPFLARFNAIFTLNQDMLLERHYIPSRNQGGTARSIVVGVPDRLNVPQHHYPPVAPIVPPNVDPACQPIFKLHGSAEWRTAEGEPMMVLGSNKANMTLQHAILRWSIERFTEYLKRPETRLMVIGYSFGDLHINQKIWDAIAVHPEFKVFIIDPVGVDVLYQDKRAEKARREASIGYPTNDKNYSNLKPAIIGASRRLLKATLREDHAERQKVMRFFE